MKKIFKKVVVAVLLWEAKLVLWKYRPKIIAITGSVGKTSTKDAIFNVLKDSVAARKSEKSFNSEIGVPLTILGLQNAWSNPFLWVKNFLKGLKIIIFRTPYPKVLVLEIGVGVPGDMERITRIVKPDMVVLTHLAKVPVHVEFFGTPEKVYEEKGKLIEALKEDGLFLVCGDDKRAFAMRKLTKARCLPYGFDPEKNFMVGSSPEILYEKRLGGLRAPSGLLFRVDYEGTSLPVRIYGTLGRQNMYSALAAMLCGVSMNLNIVEITERFRDYRAPAGRMRIIEGVKNSTIIDDSYNSSPAAVRALFETMEAVETEGRKIAVLGDMLELGQYSQEEHRKVGKAAAGIFDFLVTIGKRARDIAEGALDEKMDEKKILQFEESRAAGLFLQNMISRGDVIAVKGSQGSGANAIRTEKTVLEIMAHPEERKKLLVRQDREWEDR
ncbi:MAG TPA: UDP-N-acetylmuramoyl-tripeptide--D-alanyl-D-alanine ligase [Candidatus Paceibacterota bacterium]|nr:UDP-N-acetylmuramoyl-tripeptide--D-alanyl-D-alanine ligase [Candidatus Paceibacterota bacterium]